jgi:hypothetical protein
VIAIITSKRRLLLQSLLSFALLAAWLKGFLQAVPNDAMEEQFGALAYACNRSATWARADLKSLRHRD